MRAAAPTLLALALFGCARPPVTREPRVAVRPRQGDDDSALVVSYPATLCSVTLRDENGRLHDQVKDRDSVTRIDMTRAVPEHPWRLHGGTPATLATALALPPGRYTLTAYTTSDDWSELEPSGGGPLARTDCSSGLDVHATRIPFRIERGKLTLLDLPSGGTDFDALRMMSFALDDPYVTSTMRSWLSAVRRTGSAMHRELAARQRQPRDGYDVYPRCDGKVAVVRTSGTPFDWYRRPDDETARRTFRHRAVTPARSVQATGFGRGCIEPLAFVYLLSDPKELETLSRTVGAMMAAENLAGEIDLVLTAPLELAR